MSSHSNKLTTGETLSIVGVVGLILSFVVGWFVKMWGDHLQSQYKAQNPQADMSAYSNVYSTSGYWMMVVSGSILAVMIIVMASRGHGMIMFM
jgi:hypothetical protein